MEEYIIKTKMGKIRGYKNISPFSKHTYYSFSGIPYGKPPVDELRFRPPIPYGNWKGIYDGRKERDDCIQYAFLFKNIVGSEDCLYLNIHIPEYPPPQENLKSVIIHLHGGGYTFGSANREFYGSPDFVIHKDFVYVNFNYRLHVLGFLNLDLPECPGNVGLKDIVLAMQWVKQNIQAFGGDPNNITVFGCSSTASAIHLLMMHPQHRNLFNKAIMSGSCATNPAINYCENHLQRASQLAEIMGYHETKPRKLLHFFKKQNAREMVEALNMLRKALLPVNRLTAQHNLFIPSIEKFPKDAILSKNPFNLLHTIDPIPVMYGVCNLDGMQAFAQGSPVQSLAHEFKDAIKRILWTYKMDEILLQEVADKIKAFYFPDGKINVKKCKQICDFYQDTWQAEMYMSFLDVIYRKDPKTALYIYEFGYEGSYNIAKRVCLRHLPQYIEGTKDEAIALLEFRIYFEIKVDHWEKLFYQIISHKIAPHHGYHIIMLKYIQVSRADHGDDYFYFVALHNEIFNHTQNDVVIVEYMTELFSNFAKYGNPNSELTKAIHWKPYTIEHPSYLKVNLELEIVHGKLNEERIKFWEELINYIKSKCI